MTEKSQGTLSLQEEEGEKNCHKGIWEGSSKKVTQLIAQLKCLYTNACSAGNKQEEKEAMMP